MPVESEAVKSSNVFLALTEDACTEVTEKGLHKLTKI